MIDATSTAMAVLGGHLTNDGRRAAAVELRWLADRAEGPAAARFFRSVADALDELAAATETETTP